MKAEEPPPVFRQPTVRQSEYLQNELSPFQSSRLSVSAWAALERCTDGPGQGRWWRTNLTVEPAALDWAF